MTPRLELCYNDDKAVFRRFAEVVAMQGHEIDVQALLVALAALVEAVLKVLAVLTAA